VAAAGVRLSVISPGVADAGEPGARWEEVEAMGFLEAVTVIQLSLLRECEDAG